MSPKRDPKPVERGGSWRNKIPSKDQFLFLPRVLKPAERRFMIGVFILALGALLALPISAYYHTTTPVAAHGGSWTEAIVGGPQHINPLLIQANDSDSGLTNLIYSGLLRYDGNGNLVNDLAESYTISDNGLQYTFKLRSGLQWHDGKPLTADDVVFTIMTAQNSEYASVQHVVWQGIEVIKKDDLTVSFKLKNRYAQFLQNATLGILPKNIWEPVNPANFSLFEKNLKPIGSGPYKFSKLNRAGDGKIESYELIAFDHFALGKPFISKITFKFYTSENAAITGYNNGDVNGLGAISSRNVDQLRLRGQLNILGIKIPRYFAVFFNQTKSKALSGKTLRMALEYATNKDLLVKEILDGRGVKVDSPLLPGIIQISPPTQPYAYDLEKAKGLFGTTATASFELTTSSNLPDLPQLAESLKKQWAQVGVHVTVKSMSIAEIHQAIKDRNYEALLFGEGFGVDPDPFSFWHSSERRDPGLNLALYDNKDADKLLEDARQTIDQLERLAKYDKLQNIILADAPAVFLYSPDYLYVQPRTIHGNTTKLINTPSGRFNTVYQWYIDTKRATK